MTLEEAKTNGITTSGTSNKLFSTGASYWLSTSNLSYSKYHVDMHYIAPKGYWNCNGGVLDHDACMGIRLIIDMEEGVYIDGGTGTQENPYVLAKD